MRKTAFVLGIALVAVFMTTGCDDLITDLTTPNVTFVAINDGAQLRLTWAPVTDAEGYKVEVDDSTYTITATTYDVAGPAKSISVLAYSGTSESNKWSKNLIAIITTTLDAYGKSDPDPSHPSGIGFDVDGNCLSYNLEAVNHPKLDFVMDDTQDGDMLFSSPNRYSPPFNDKDNAVAEASGTDFDAATSAAGDFYTVKACVSGAVYYIWLDPSANGWDATEDHFGKVKVLSIQGTKVTMKLALQTVPGLLWVKTN